LVSEVVSLLYFERKLAKFYSSDKRDEAIFDPIFHNGFKMNFDDLF